MGLRSNVRFRRLFAGRLVTNAGDSLYLIATMWLIYELTGSTAYTGLAGFLLTLPTALQFLVGPLVDRWSPRPLLVGTQVIQAGVVLAIPLAWATGRLSVWLLLAVVPVLSLLNQFVYPTLNAVLPRVVAEDELMGANSAFAAAYQGVDMVFNAVGGVVIALVGAVSLFVVDAATFVVAAITFAAVHIPRARQPTDASTAADGGESAADSDAEGNDDSTLRSYLADLRAGVEYFWGTVLWKMSLTVFVGIATAWATFASLPAFADARGGAALYGLLMAAIAGGVTIGFLVAPRLRDRAFGRVMVVVHPLGAAAWAGVVLLEWTPAVLAFATLATVLIGIYTVSTQTIVQTVVPEHLLGRVTALSASFAGVAAPLGSLVGGALGDVVGPVPGTAMLGVGILAVGVVFLLDRDMRRLPAVTAMGPDDLGLPTDAVE